MPSSSSHQSTPSSSGGRDIVTDLDRSKHQQEWAHSIIDAMAKIQTQYAIERKLDQNLPKDYLTDADKIKFFWSGFSNSSKPKHFLDIIFTSVINWEVIFIVLFSILGQVFTLAFFDNSRTISILTFICSYFSVITYSLYITKHFNYYVFGDISSRMMFYLMIGRLCFLALSSTILTSFLYWLVQFFEANPKTLYGWTNGFYWITNLFFQAHYIFGDRENFFYFVFKLVLPEIQNTADEMIFVFLLFGLLPFAVLLIGKILRIFRIKREQNRFKKGL